MRSLVLYYSKDGYTKEIAEQISEDIGADIERVIPLNDLPVEKDVNNLLVLFMILFKEKPKILELKHNLQDYDLIYIGSPVWFGSLPPFIRTLLLKYNFKGKSVGIFCCGDSSSKTALIKMARLIKNADIIGELDLNKEEGNFVNSNKSREWARALYGKKSRM